ncbi:MAG TPA: calcium-binding protein, partial [Solirubrobacterales bacterium]
PSAISVGSMAPQAELLPGLYLSGSDEADHATATFAPGSVTFTLGAGSAGDFDPSPSAAGGCEPPGPDAVLCPVDGPPDAVVLAGMDGDDTLTAAGFPETTSVILLGGAGADQLVGGETEDAVVDGSGPDIAFAAGRDDAVPNNEGADDLDAGAGEDLFVSNSVCEGDLLDGGPDRDNANWANFGSGVSIDMSAELAGLVGADGKPTCGPDPLSTLRGIEDIEGTNHDDTLVGNGGDNQILGRLGADSYFAAPGNDHILANSGDSDLVIDCGDGFDTALIDIPTSTYQDPSPTACESVEERPPNSFRPPDTPPGPEPPDADQPLPPPPQQTIRDTRPPQTRIKHRPPRRSLTKRKSRRVAFRFAANERARFRCKIDRRRYGSCRSPRIYRLRPGRHVFRVFAIDRAGNRDRTPARFGFRVKRVSAR